MPDRRIGGALATGVLPRCVLTVALLALSPACAPETPARPLNVVVIMVDTLRADHLGSYGYERNTSPRIDQFARSALLFERNWAQAPCTYPSVNSMLTSRYPVHLIDRLDAGDLGITEGTATLAEMMRARGYDTYAVSASPIVRVTPSRFNKVGGFGRGFDVFHEGCVWKDASCVNRAGGPIIRKYAGAAESRPFFLYLHYMDPHAPYRPPEGFASRFAGAYQGEKEWVAGGDPNPLAAMLYGGDAAVEFTLSDIDHLKARYDDEIAFADSEIGALLDEIELSGLTGSTLVVIAADHGESFMENGQMKHCYHLYEHNVRTPLIIRVPGQAGGRRVDAVTSNLDVVPTILDLVDEFLPSRVGDESALLSRGIQGVSLRSLIDDAADEARSERVAFASIGSLRMVTDGRFKLTRDLGSGELELFDLDADPGEARNVATEQRRVAHRLEERLDTWMRREEGDGTGLEKSEEAQRRLKALGYLQ